MAFNRSLSIDWFDWFVCFSPVSDQKEEKIKLLMKRWENSWILSGDPLHLPVHFRLLAWQTIRLFDVAARSGSLFSNPSFSHCGLWKSCTFFFFGPPVRFPLTGSVSDCQVEMELFNWTAAISFQAKSTLDNWLTISSSLTMVLNFNQAEKTCWLCIVIESSNRKSPLLSLGV